MASPPYTNKVQNGARLAALLINEGTPALRFIFDTRVRKNGHTLDQVLRKNQEHIRSSSHVSKKQYDQMFPSQQKKPVTSESFDISLLAVLMSVVCNEQPPPSTGSWGNKAPAIDDKSIAADVVRLRNLRNELYGHVVNTGIEDKDFPPYWDFLQCILLRLGAPRDNIEQWKLANIDNREVGLLRTKLTEQMENDAESLREIVSYLMNNQTFQETLVDELENIKSFMQGKMVLDEFMAAKILAFSSPLMKDILDQIKSSSTEHRMEVLAETKKLGDKLDAILDNQNAGDTTMSAVSTTTDTLTDVEQKYKDLGGSSFNILVMTSPSGHESCEQLGKALGYIPWNIVIDLDHDPEGSNSIYDSVTSTLAKQKSICVLTYKAVKRVNEEDQQAVATGNMVMWIQGNVCSVEQCEAALNLKSEFAKAKHNLTILVEEVMMKMSSNQSVLCTTLFMGGCDKITTKATLQLVEAVDQACLRVDDYITDVQYIAMATEDEHALRDLQEQHENVITGLATLNQISGMVMQVFDKDFISSYSYPGRAYRCYLPCEVMVKIKGMLQLYHNKYGQIDFGALDADEIKAKKMIIRESFHKGNIISPEALFLDATRQDTIYVHRKEMKQIEVEVRKELQSKTPTNMKPSFVTMRELKHKACSGASTCVKHLLYSLKDEYPCIELLRLNDYVYGTLKKIAFDSKMPMLLVADDPKQFSRSDLQSLTSSLSNDLVHGVLLYTSHVISEPAKGSLYMPASIKNEADLDRFRNLYKQHAREGTVFLFGLLAFLDNYLKMDSQISLCCEHMTPTQHRIVRLTCFVYKYGRIGINRRVIATLAGETSNKHLLDRLGSAGDILIHDNRGSIRPAVMQIVDKTLETLDPTDEGDRLRMFVADFELVLKDKHCTDTDTFPLLRSVFIHRETKDEFSHWSPFITDLQHKCGKEYVVSVLENIACLGDHNQSKHLQTLKARYLMHQMNKPEEAIREIRQVLELEEGESVKNTRITDNVLLSAYGHLHKDFVQKCCRTDAQKLKEARNYSNEAIWALERAQNPSWNCFDERRNNYSVRPFVSEARVRYQLLAIVLEHQFNFDLKRFRAYIDKPKDELLQSSEKKALFTLAKLESLIERDMVHDSNPIATKEDILRLKFDFLALRVVGKIQKNSKALRRAIANIPKNVCVDIGAFFKREQGSQKEKSWVELIDEELVFLIHQLNPRVRGDNALARNFNDLIMAMVHMRMRGQESKGPVEFNIAYAKQCATSWVKKFGKDHQAHFMLGAITLIQALEENNDKYFLDSTTHFKKCGQLCSKSMTGLGKKRYFIGNKCGLARLVPRESESSDMTHETFVQERLQTFIGRQINGNTIVAHYGNNDSAFRAHIAASKAITHRARGEQPLVEFEVVLAFDNIIAMNVRTMNVPKEPTVQE